ncbi:hypothetical protein L917_00594, partial [Phytophthora nicotianae]
TTSTVYFRQQSGGSIFAIDGRDGSETEIEGSSEYARFVGLAIHRRYGRIFWSGGRIIIQAYIYTRRSQTNIRFIYQR